MQNFEWSGAEALIATAAFLLSLLSFGFSWWLDRRGHQRDDRIEKSTAYLQLEMHSSEAFRYAAENNDAMRPYQPSEPPHPAPKRNSEAAQITRQYYYQCLNMFEVCSNFRRNGVIEKEVYASWVSWFHEVLDQWYFRELWEEEARDNYTRDVRNLLDAGVEIYRLHSDPDTRLRQFYLAASHMLGGCRIIRDWLDELDERPQWPPAEHGKVAMVRRLQP